MRIKLADNLEIKMEDFKREGIRVAILAASGYGKSNLAALFVEQGIEQGLQTLIIEPISEFHTLKARYPNVVVFGGPYKDAPLDPDAHKLIIDFLEKSHASAVLCLEDIEDEYLQKQFIAKLLYGIYRRWAKLRRPLLLVLEEADEIAPEIATKESFDSRRKVALIMKRGRKVGIIPILITQRPADVAKSALSQANIIFFGCFKSPQDLNPRAGVMFLAKKLHIPITEKEVTELRPGEFYAWIKRKVVKIKAYWRKTPHGGETPIVQVKPIPPKLGKPLEDLRKQLEQLALKRREEQNLIAKLKRELEEKEKRIKELEEELKVLKTVKEIPIEIKAKPIEIPVKTSSKSETTVVAEPKKVELSIDVLPNPVRKCPTAGAVELYFYLKKAKGWVRPSDIQRNTGLSQERIKKILKYLYRYKLLNVRWRAGKRFKVVRLRE